MRFRSLRKFLEKCRVEPLNGARAITLNKEAKNNFAIGLERLDELELNVLAEPVLVGRELELEKLRRCLEFALQGKGKTVFISAEAGGGKTRLVQEFLDSVKGKMDVQKLSGWCLFNAGVPYFPFIEAFGSYYSSLSGEGEKEELELNSWLKGPPKRGLSGALEYLSPQALKDQTFATVAKTLRSIASRAPVVFVVEDVHWADSASLALLHYLARAVNDSERVLVVATFRSEELTNDDEGYPHPLVETLCMMRREDLFSELKLSSLDPACVVRMAESILGGRLQEALAKKLASESGGNPLFIVESLRMLNERHGLAKENDEWGLTVDEIGIPFKFRDIMLQRLARLNNAQRRLLDAASVIGEEFEAGLLSAVVEQDSLEVLETLNVISHSTSLVCAGEDRYRFDHARSREMLYEALSPPLKGAYHGKIAEKLDSHKTANALPLRDLAYHYSQAGNKEKAIEYALAAGKDELSRWSNKEAIKHFQYVLQNITEEQSQEKRTALEGLGDAYIASYLFAGAIKTFDELAAIGTGSVRLRAIRKAMLAAYHKGDKPDLLLEYAKKAQALATDDRLEMARIRINSARAIGWSGRGNVKMELAEYDSALKVFEEENSLVDVAEGLWRSGVVCLYFEDLWKKGVSELLRSAAIFRDIGYVRKEILVTMWTGDVFLGMGLISEAEHRLNDVLRLGDKMDVFGELAGAHGYLGDIAETEGKFSRALSHSLKCLEYSEKTDLVISQGFAYASLARQYSKLGDLNRADTYFDKMAKLPPELLSQVMLAPTIAIAKGVYLAAKGLWAESNQVFEKITSSVDPSIVRRVEKIARPNYAWMLERQGRLEESKFQLDQLQKQKERTVEIFRHADVQLSLLLPRKVQMGEEFNIRLDLINVSMNAGILVRIEGLIPQGSKATSTTTFCQVQNGSVDMNQKKIGPFQVETIKLSAVFPKADVYKLEPFVFYLDDLGHTEKTRVEPITVMAISVPSKAKVESVPELKNGTLNFRSKAAEKAFNYLVTAFKEDHLKHSLSEEESGWRTLMEVVKKGHVSKHSMYGQSGRGGEATAELRHSGLVESRFFFGERARGGKALKIRISQVETNLVA